MAARLMRALETDTPRRAIDHALAVLDRVGGEAGLMRHRSSGPHRLGAQQRQLRRRPCFAWDAAPGLHPSFGRPEEDLSDVMDREGPLIIIGGHEDKEGDKVILRAVAERLNGGKLVLATIASRAPEGYFESYQKAFGALGVDNLVELYVEDRANTHDDETLALLDGAAGVFFSGGDQLRISSQIGDTPIEKQIREIWRAGGVLAGTSAGASVMSDTMMVRGSSAETHRIGDLQMAPGLGLVRDVIIDQHFAERAASAVCWAPSPKARESWAWASTRTRRSSWRAMTSTSSAAAESMLSTPRA
ncbi:cyanophycinase [Caulobacter segnis]